MGGTTKTVIKLWTLEVMMQLRDFQDGMWKVKYGTVSHNASTAKLRRHNNR